MAEILRPRTRRELFNQTFELMFSQLPALTAIQAIFWLPVSAFNYLATTLVSDMEVRLDGQSGAVVNSDMLTGGVELAFQFVAGLIVTPIMSAASMVVISGRFTGRRTSVGRAIKLALGRFGSLISVAFIVNVGAGLCMLLGLVFLGAAMFIGGFMAILGLLVAIACAVLSIRIQMTFGVAAPAVVLEDLRARAALQRSRELTLGFRRTIFLLTVSIGMVLVGLNFALRIVLQATGALAVLQSKLIAAWAFDTVWSMIGSMVFCVAIIAVYFDLRVRKDGFDLDNLAELVDVIAQRAAIPGDSRGASSPISEAGRAEDDLTGGDPN